MTPHEADQRIIVSRQALAAFIRSVRATGAYPVADLILVRDEIALLEGIAEAHPSKALKLVKLVTWWRAFEANARATLH